MPENSISVASVNTENQTVLLLNTDWKVPFNTDFPDQQYYTGYLERAYNVKFFNASYLILLFTILTVLSENSILTAVK